jgi:hypothetical protein
LSLSLGCYQLLFSGFEEKEHGLSIQILIQPQVPMELQKIGFSHLKEQKKIGKALIG